MGRISKTFEVASLGVGATLGKGQVDLEAKQCFTATWIPNVVFAKDKKFCMHSLFDATSSWMCYSC